MMYAPRVVAYARLVGRERRSTERQHRGAMEAMREVLRVHAHRFHLDMVVTVEEGMEDTGAGLATALDFLHKPGIDGLLLPSLRVLGPSFPSWFAILATYFVPGANCPSSLHVVEHQIDSRYKEGRARLQLVLDLARDHHEHLAERTREGMRRRKAEGAHVGRRRWDGNEEMHELAREMWRMRHERGLSDQEIADTLNHGGRVRVTPTGPKVWTRSGVQAARARVNAEMIAADV